MCIVATRWAPPWPLWACRATRPRPWGWSTCCRRGTCCPPDPSPPPRPPCPRTCRRSTVTQSKPPRRPPAEHITAPQLHHLLRNLASVRAHVLFMISFIIVKYGFYYHFKIVIHHYTIHFYKLLHILDYVQYLVAMWHATESIQYNCRYFKQKQTTDLTTSPLHLPLLPPRLPLRPFHRVFRCTLSSIPQTQSLLNKAKLPLGLLLHPFKDLSVTLVSGSF